jgi:ribonuclease P/MRP protein subunit RPP40
MDDKRTGLLYKNAVLSQLTRAFHYRDRYIFKKLYVQYVRPHLEFAATAWSPSLEADKAVLEKIQQRAVTMVSGLKGKT